MVSQEEIGKWCRYVNDGVPGPEGTLEKIEGNWGSLRGEDDDGVKDSDTHDFHVSMLEVAPVDLGTVAGEAS